MKVIDLINKISKGEEVPKMFRYIDEDKCGYVFEQGIEGDYWNEELCDTFFNNYDIQNILNDDLEIIKEPEKNEEPAIMELTFSPDGISFFGPRPKKEFNKEDFLKIINHFGEENQREYLGKEYQELQDELYKYVVCGDECEMLTEIADVFVLCLQFLFEYGYELEDLKEEINSKVKRTLKRMKEGYYEANTR